MLDNLQIEEREVVHVPEIFQVPSSQIAAVECEKMLVRELCDRPHNSRYVGFTEMLVESSMSAVFDMICCLNTT
jgi:hypothetical protein